MININKLVGLLLFIAVFQLPGGYYELLRIIVSLCSVYNIYKGFYAFIPILILFNPIAPIYLYNKAFWVLIDIICGLAFYFTETENN
tara:strand:- start:45 stop:305 length:261 start_codon:yes stop_codon:yes gene_type:complete